MTEALVTISRRTSSTANDVISINITDNLSGNRVVEVEMSLHNFSMCITGLSHSPAKYTFCPTSDTALLYKKTRVVDTWFCKKVDNKNLQRSTVKSDFTFRNDGEWSLYHDGTDTQQNATKHHYTVVKYI